MYASMINGPKRQMLIGRHARLGDPTSQEEIRPHSLLLLAMEGGKSSHVASRETLRRRTNPCRAVNRNVVMR